jgi:hypothetical protein
MDACIQEGKKIIERCMAARKMLTNASCSHIVSRVGGARAATPRTG